MGKEKVRRMTSEEIKDFCDMKAQLEPENEDIFKAIVKALEQLPKLQNRCHALTHGLMCGFCSYECEHKVESEDNNGSN